MVHVQRLRQKLCCLLRISWACALFPLYTARTQVDSEAEEWEISACPLSSAGRQKHFWTCEIKWWRFPQSQIWPKWPAAPHTCWRLSASCRTSAKPRTWSVSSHRRTSGWRRSPAAWGPCWTSLWCYWPWCFRTWAWAETGCRRTRSWSQICTWGASSARRTPTRSGQSRDPRREKWCTPQPGGTWWSCNEAACRWRRNGQKTWRPEWTESPRHTCAARRLAEHREDSRPCWSQ